MHFTCFFKGGHTFDLTAPDTPIFESLEEEAVVMQQAISNVDSLKVRLVKVVTGCEDERTYLDLPDSLPPVAGIGQHNSKPEMKSKFSRIIPPVSREISMLLC